MFVTPDNVQILHVGVLPLMDINEGRDFDKDREYGLRTQGGPKDGPDLRDEKALSDGVTVKGNISGEWNCPSSEQPSVYWPSDHLLVSADIIFE